MSLHNDATDFSSYQHVQRFIFLYILKLYLLSLVFSGNNNSSYGKLYFLVVLVYIFLMISDYHFFTYLLSFCICFFKRRQFRFVAIFEHCNLGLSPLGIQSYLYVLNINIISDKQFVNIFPGLSKSSRS